MFAGTKDRLNQIADVRWSRDQISKPSPNQHWMTGKKLDNVLVHYEEDNASHLSWFIGNDMSYLNRLIDLVKKWNPRPLTSDEKKYKYIPGEEDSYEKELDNVYRKYTDSKNDDE